MDLTTKLFFVGIALQLIVVYCECLSSAESSQAVQLLKYDPETEKFVLNETGLEVLRGLSQPIQVISAIGDARVGKSTSMNIVQHLWQRHSPQQYSEVFETGDTVVAVTRGVWISVDRGKNGTERVILDVEGTDLVDDTITDHLSIFTALMSSGMTFFMQNAVKTHSVDFLFRVSRLTDVIFKDEPIKNFPQLRVVMRGALQTPPGTQIKDYVRDALVGSNFTGGSYKKREAIAKHFARDNIEVTTIEDLEDRTIFKDFGRLSKTDYMKSMQALAENLKHFPVKKTLKGGLMDGTTLAELAVKLVQTMANDTLPDFGNVYLMIEKHLCDRRYEAIVQPQIKLSSQSIKQFLASGFSRFEKECALKEYVSFTKTELTRIMNTKEELEQKQKQLVIETEKRKAEEKKRIQAEKDFNKDKEKMGKDLQDEKDKRATLEKETQALHRQNGQIQNDIASLQSQLRESQTRLKRLRDSDGGFFLKLVNAVVDTFVKIIRIPIEIVRP